MPCSCCLPGVLHPDAYLCIFFPPQLGRQICFLERRLGALGAQVRLCLPVAQRDWGDAGWQPVCVFLGSSVPVCRRTWEMGDGCGAWGLQLLAAAVVMAVGGKLWGQDEVARWRVGLLKSCWLWTPHPPNQRTAMSLFGFPLAVRCRTDDSMGCVSPSCLCLCSLLDL